MLFSDSRPLPLPHGRGYALPKFGVRLTAGEICVATNAANKGSALRRTLLASLDRDAFRLFPHPCPSPTGRGTRRILTSVTENMQWRRTLLKGIRSAGYDEKDTTYALKRNSLALMLFLDSYPCPPPTWEGV